MTSRCPHLFALLLTSLAAFPAFPQAPALQTLSDADIGTGCGCRFGRQPGETLLYFSTVEPRQAFIRANGSVRPLRLVEERFLPLQREPARVNDHRVVYLSDGTWNVQVAGMVTASCAPKAKRCIGTSYRSKLVVQWEGRQITEINGSGHCSC